MSKVVDERVVSMQFDNKHFESNVKTSMSTIDKLKQKLRLTDAAKGLENIDKASRKVNLSGLSSATETVGLKFNAMYTIADQALRNITNSAVNYGKRIVSALTVDPVKDGWQEYEMTLNAVQTTMAGTGKTAEEVEKELKKLDEYADKTVYGTADMLNNLPKFTNAGVELEDATTAMIGIANATALAGGDASKASIAFYNLGQAIGTGYLSRMDYNSINNAGIATMEWKKQMIDAAIHAKTLTKVGDDLYKAGGKTFTMQQLFIDGLQTQWATTDVMMKVFKDYGSEQTEIGKAAYSAAQDIKTYTMMMESLKATAGTGWKDTWQLIFGGLDEAKEFWTGLTDTISGVITGMADFRNRVLEIALNFSGPWDILSGKLGFVDKIKETVKTVGDLADKLEYYQDIVTKVWRGDYNNQGDNPDRRDLLKKDGYDARVVQDLVNKGYLYKLTVEDIEASYKKFGLTFEESNKQIQKTTDSIANLTDEQLKNADLTDEEIKLYRALAKEASRMGISIEELADRMSKQDGRSLLIDSFKNFGDAITGVLKSIKDAYVEIFNPPGAEELGIRLYGIISALNEFSKMVRLTDESTGELNETGQKFKRIFKGVFALVDIFATIIGGPLRLAFKAIKALLGYFNLDILSVLAYVGDAAVGFRDWTDSVLDFTKIFAKVIPILKDAGIAVYNWFKSLKEVDNVPQYIIQGLVNGIKKGYKAVGEAMWNLGMTIIDKVKEVLRIESPSKVFITIGGFIIAGLIYGIRNGFGSLMDTVKNIFTSIINYVSTIDFGTLLTAAIMSGLVFSVGTFAKALINITSPLEGLGDMFEGIGSYFKGAAWEKRSKAILNMVIALGLLIAAVVILSKIDTDGAWEAIRIIGALAGILVALAFATKQISAASASVGKDGVKIKGLTSGLLGMSSAILLMGLTIKLISGIDEDKALQGFIGLIGIVEVLVIFMAVCGKIINTETMANIDKLGVVFLKLGITLLLMTYVVKTAAKIKPVDLRRGMAVMAALEAFVLAVALVARLAGANADKAGAMMLKMSVAMFIMVAVVKMAAHLKQSEVSKGLKFVAGVEALFAAVIAFSLLAGANADKAGAMILKMSVAMLLMTAVVKIVANIDGSDLKRAMIAVATMELLFAEIIGMSYFAGEHSDKIGGMLIKMSVALLILTGVIFLLGLIDPNRMYRALGAIVVLEACFAGLIGITKYAQSTKEMKSTLLLLTVALTLLVGAVVGLSFLDQGRLRNATLAISSIMGMLSVMLVATKYAGQVKVGNLFGIVGVVATIAGILSAMALLGVDASIKTAGALSLLLLTMTGSLVILSVMSSKSAGAAPAIGALALLGLVVAEIAVIVGLLSKFGGDRLIEASVSLSILLLAMSGVLGILSAIGMAAINAIPAIMVIVGAIAAIGLLMYEVGKLSANNPDMQKFISESIPLLSEIGRGIGAFIGSIFGGFGEGITNSLPKIGENLSEFMDNLGGFIEGSKQINGEVAAGVATLAGCIAALGAANIIECWTSLFGLNDLTDLADDLSSFMRKLTKEGGFIEGAKSIDASVATSVGYLATAIAAFSAANFLDGISNLLGLSEGGSLENFTKQIEPFGEAMVNFSKTVSGNIDAGAVEAAANAGKMLTTLANEIPNQGGWLAEMVGDNTLDVFGWDLEEFGKSMVIFSNTLTENGGVDAKAIESAANAGKIMTALANEIPNQGGWLANIVGDNTLDVFGWDLEEFGKSIVLFSKSLTKDGGIDSKAIEAAANAGKFMTALANEIPNQGGWLAAIVGDNTLDYFGYDLEEFGESMVSFSKSLTRDGGIKQEAVESAASLTGMMIELSKEIPNQGGLLALFSGDNTLYKFGSDLAGFGGKLGNFHDNVKYIDFGKVNNAAGNMSSLIGALDEFVSSGYNSKGDPLYKFGSDLAGLGGKLGAFHDNVKYIDFSKVSTAATSIKLLAGAAKAVNDSGLAGQDNKLFPFGSDLAGLGGKLGAFHDNVKYIDFSKVSTAASIIPTLANAAKSVHNAGLAGKDNQLTPFGSDLAGFGGKLYDFSNNVSSLSSTSIDTAITEINKLASMSKNLVGVNTSSMTSFGSALTKLAKADVNGFISVFTGAVDRTTKAVSNFVKAIASAVKKEQGSIKKAGESLADSLVKGIRASYSSFYAAGSYLVDGFASGISANTFKAKAKAVAMAAAALEAAKEELDINSPSEEAYKVGDFFGIGFVNGVSDNVRNAYKISAELADSAKTGLSGAIDKVRDLIDTGIDTQPTIRPVLDLSDVKSGANSLGKMLYGRTLSVDTSSATAISASMQKIQNGRNNSELVSAIKGLREDLAAKSGDTYQINGITYDDGSNVVNAVKDLVHAVKIERRV